MGNYFITSFADVENDSYAERFHQDLVREVEQQAGAIIAAELCRGGNSPETNRPLMADASVMVSLCSPHYYADRGCGYDWALFERRLGRVPAARTPYGPSARVLVRWRPVSPPLGLPRPRVNSADAAALYARIGLEGVMIERGWDSDEYYAALRQIAAEVRGGREVSPPVLPARDSLDVQPAFPLADPVDLPAPRRPDPEAAAQPRIFISYAHDKNDPGHKKRVAALATLLRRNGVNAVLDQDAARQPQNWARWMDTECEAADFIVMVASPAYKRRAELREVKGVGRGVMWEGSYIWDYVYDNPREWQRRVLRVVFPEHGERDLPKFPGSTSTTYYAIDPERGGHDLDLLLDYVLGRTS